MATKKFRAFTDAERYALKALKAVVRPGTVFPVSVDELRSGVITTTTTTAGTVGWATLPTVTPIEKVTVAGGIIFDDVNTGVLRHIHGLDSPNYLGTIWEMIADYNEGKEL